MDDPSKPSASNPKNNPKLKIKKNARPLVDLLLEMSMKDDDRETAVKAFDEIIERFESHLKRTAINALYRNSTYDPADLVTIMNNTFLYLFDNAANLLHIDTLETESRKEAQIKAWLNTIARREAAKINTALDDYYGRFLQRDFTERDMQQEWNDSPEDEPVPEKMTIETFNDEGERQRCEEIKLVLNDDEEISLSSEEKIVFTEVLNECTARERVIILTYYDYLEGRKYLPREEIQRLCKEFGILPDNLNHIKDRTLKRIRQKCLERMQAKNPDYRLRE